LSAAKGPKGVVVVQPRMLEARAMRRDGKTQAQVAAHFGVSVGAIQKWVQRVEEAEADARNRKAM
jgi:transposase